MTKKLSPAKSKTRKSHNEYRERDREKERDSRRGREKLNPHLSVKRAAQKRPYATCSMFS